MQPTKLGRTLAGDIPKLPAASAFINALSGRRALRRLTIPMLELPAAMTLVGTMRRNEIESQVSRWMKERDLDAGLLNQSAWELARAVHTLAAAVLEDDPAKGTAAAPIGTVDEWGQLPPEIVVEMWRTYNDLSEEHDPGELAALSDEDIAYIRDAIAKKNARALRACGVRRLSLYSLTLADPPAS